ncbi:nitrilase-related carbon-nitrogen hydrolase [Flavobacterium sp. JP2137]|uniref:nitrilase-related carbon-nitrogen hydrolase n=1 Tax=Flavobacterium sp. JP2137 TaxID=3414510 RepID=UPI003D2FA168
MKVGFFQYAVITRDRKANLAYITSKLQHQKFDLLVLPELFTSGYAFDDKCELQPFAEDLTNCETVACLTELAAKCGAV